MDKQLENPYDLKFLRQLGERIRRIRAINGSEMLKEFARRLDVSESYMSHIEYGKAPGLTVALLKKIADGLQTEMCDLVDVNQGELREISDADIQLARLYSRIEKLDDDQKKLLAGTVRAMLDNLNSLQTKKRNELRQQLLPMQTAASERKQRRRIRSVDTDRKVM